MACRQLGFTGDRGRAVLSYQVSSLFGASSGPVLMDGVMCTGAEAYLAACRFNGWGVSTCDPTTHAVGLDCLGTLTPPAPDEAAPPGEVWAPPSSPSPPDINQGDPPPIEGNIGDPPASPNPPPPPKPSPPPPYDQLDGPPPDVPAASPPPTYGPPPSPEAPPGPPPSVPAPADGTPQLVYGSPIAGILEVFVNGLWMLPYMSLSQQPVSHGVATVVCRGLGYNPAPVQPDPYSYGWPTSPALLLGDLTCEGDEASLLECDMVVLPPEQMPEDATPLAVACTYLDVSSPPPKPTGFPPSPPVYGGYPPPPSTPPAPPGYLPGDAYTAAGSVGARIPATPQPTLFLSLLCPPRSYAVALVMRDQLLASQLGLECSSANPPCADVEPPASPPPGYPPNAPPRPRNPLRIEFKPPGCARRLLTVSETIVDNSFSVVDASLVNAWGDPAAARPVYLGAVDPAEGGAQWQPPLRAVCDDTFEALRTRTEPGDLLPTQLSLRCGAGNWTEPAMGSAGVDLQPDPRVLQCPPGTRVAGIVAATQQAPESWSVDPDARVVESISLYCSKCR
ncbi:hypothetical protein HYH03_004105 [Edaphochlamys debaryana]|uniref:SRCR domain-containing protein n=1 Tax=Edaphochlamys debaryana TaxID=47281 RepID=A0A835Y7R8_9CHLO|nr:hypothetical protein HYH03_004105 [Edaphochlamys debaryana]|eukprot:KAG2497835.1 hypothetical protein HYH03_004105 [Edaphochlamys debaryana]